MFRRGEGSRNTIPYDSRDLPQVEAEVKREGEEQRVEGEIAGFRGPGRLRPTSRCAECDSSLRREGGAPTGYRISNQTSVFRPTGDPVPSRKQRLEDWEEDDLAEEGHRVRQGG